MKNTYQLSRGTFANSGLKRKPEVTDIFKIIKDKIVILNKIVAFNCMQCFGDFLIIYMPELLVSLRTSNC